MRRLQIWRYLRLHEIENIDTSIEESPGDSDGRKTGNPYRAYIMVITRRGQSIEVFIPKGADRQVNLKRLLKLWSKRL
jgi:hypothetical protein